MELAGDEKRIQALFSELRLEDQHTARRFEKGWKCAEAARTEPVPGSRRLIIVIASVLIVATVSAGAFWTHSVLTQTATIEKATTLPQIAPAAYSPSAEEPKKLVVSAPIKSRRAAQRKLVNSTMKRGSESTVYLNRRDSSPTLKERFNEDIVSISKWRSPTETFMQSPASVVLTALPELTQSVRDLESYLSNNESKELKQ
jgi:hypothetical protein